MNSETTSTNSFLHNVDTCFHKIVCYHRWIQKQAIILARSNKYQTFLELIMGRIYVGRDYVKHVFA